MTTARIAAAAQIDASCSPGGSVFITRTWFLKSTRVVLQTTSLSAQPFSWLTDVITAQTDTQTDNATPSVRIGSQLQITSQWKPTTTASN